VAVVLHVDDKEANRYTVRRMLTDASYEVLEAATGAEALQIAPTGPDIVLLDLHLPDLHGLEVCRRLRADPATARLPIVHLTATYGPRELWTEALEAGADAYLTYPVEPPVLLGTVQSLLRARAAEKAQGLADAAYRTLFDNTLIGIARSTPDGRLVLVNAATARIFGYSSAGEMVASVLSMRDIYVDPATRERIVGQVDESGSTLVEVPVRHRDGSTLWLSSVVRALPGPAGDVVGYEAVLQDITKRRTAEMALQASERRLAEAQQIAHLGSFERDLGTGAVVASDEIFRIYGFEPGPGAAPYADFLGRMHPDDREAVAEANRRAGEEGRPLALEARVLRPDGSVRVVAIRGEVIRGEDGLPRRLVGVVQDITERKQVEEQRRALLERALRVQEEERRNIARELHDEVGQSLTALKLMLDARPVPDTAARRRAMRQDAAGIVDDLLRRIRNLSLDLRPPMLDDLGLMVALTWHLDRYRERTGIRVRLAAEGVSGRCPLDVETTAFRVVQEALTNVARHAGASEASVEVRAEPTGVVVSVADDGRGFDSVTVLATAIGGLAGLRERVVLLGGNVRIASSPGAGTRVEARIPARPPQNP
jgi:two-component system sensor histidine kinase UhpB